ncbi:hypothetical protein [Aliivibrio sp. 1S128]|uniref:hypothetical protein n=1 Tax=Aliivibrio sp. 1S128 TaxID=1840085 RepID=UPI00080EE7FD|nr:hypothetical protein [Aliivibrio sp. 1S128]OCH11038.1 hypothetical protein A6E03_19120 [Aliivibrio sp. 1S128]
MVNYILFVFEGQVTEHDIMKNMQNYYLNSKTDGVYLLSSNCGDIYSLYGKLQDDSDLDIFPLLKKKQANSHLKDIKRNQISEIYLFFDYDGHAPAATDDKLLELLKHFCDETDNGKLYISYPMVESLKHVTDDDFNSLTVKAKENIGYKKIASEQCKRENISFKKLTHDSWKSLNLAHLKKMNHLVNDKNEVPTSIYEQFTILKNQIEKHIAPNNEVAVLSSYPIFLFDYYGVEAIEELTS